MIKTVLLRAGAIGDLISLTPAIKAYKQQNPEEYLTFISGKSCADALKNNPYIDQLITFDDHKLYHGGFKGKASVAANITRTLKGADKCYVMHEDMRWRLPADIAGVREVHMLADVRIANRPARYMYLLTSQHDMTTTEFYPDAPNDFELPNEYICIAPGGGRNAQQNSPDRRWQHYPALIMEKAKENHIVLLGLNEDSPGIEHPNVTDLCGHTSLSDAYHIISGANLFIGNDSGLMHLATCTSTPVHATFTSTDPDIVINQMHYHKNYCTVFSAKKLSISKI